MKSFFTRFLLSCSLAVSVGLTFNPISVSARVLDNFDDNTKTAWTDFTFIPGFGLPTEVDGQFKFNLPPVGSSIFSASTKSSETFTVQDGRTVEFRVDLVSGNGPDAFAVLAFIPKTSSAGTLAGYGFAKSTTDILITKGINKYFYNENVSPAVKNDNVTMVLSLTGQGTSVIINVKVLDKDNNNAVLFERTVVDTAAADVLSDGTDSPAAAYFGEGNFVLYAYEDNGKTQASYEVTYDNAEVFVVDHLILDDFNDNVKTAWTDFTFIPGFGLPTEEDGQFKFNLPPVGSSIFSASTKSSQTFEVKDGERLEFRVDLVSGNGQDAFAVLAFIPVSSSAGSLGGYGLAKSTTDLLITKGINKYFYNENVSPAVKNDNVTLVLSLTGRGTSVIINAKVLDKDNNNAVLFERTVEDTAAADVLSDGTDSPAAPYFGRGNFVLYCYQDNGKTQASYEVTYDNAEVWAPPVTANTPPIISEVQPAEFANFLPASTQISFQATDDKPLANGNLSIVLNGTVHTTANGLIVSGAGKSRTVTLGGLAANQNYTALLRVVDSDNVTNVFTLYFDTFLAEDLVIEVEDYNFDGGAYIDSPNLIPEGSGPQSDAYSHQVGVRDVDYSDTRQDHRDAPFRPDDSVRMQHSLDLQRQNYRDAGGAEANVYDYDVGDIIAGEWLNYTRSFAPGSYEVYLREALVNLAQGECVLERVTGDPSLPEPATVALGSFLGKLTGFRYRNFPLTDALGKKVIVRVTGTETLRLRQATSDPGDGGSYQTYLVFVPVADPGLQRATVAAVAPAAGSTVETVSPTMSATIQNRDTVVKEATIVLKLNGQIVPHTLASAGNGVTASFAISPLPPSGALNTASVTFMDNFNVSQTSEWTFTVAYKSLNPANRSAGPGLDRGICLRMAQGDPAAVPHENSLMQAEDILAGHYPLVMDTNTVIQVVNQNKRLNESAGYFPADDVVPGLFDENLTSFGNGDSDFAVEMVTWLELAPGVYRFGARTDDGFKCSSGSSLHDLDASRILGFWNGGPADQPARGEFDFVVTAAGFYPFRFMWYERGGAGYGEWYSVNLTTGDRTLINDPENPDAIKAYKTLVSLSLQSSASVGGPYADDLTATIDSGAKQITVAKNGNARFYRLRSATALKINKVEIVGNNVVLHYE